MYSATSQINQYFCFSDVRFWPPPLNGIQENFIVAHVKDWVDQEYASGRVTVLTDDELLAAIDRACEACNKKLAHE